jgi:hypothetical protein
MNDMLWLHPHIQYIMRLLYTIMIARKRSFEVHQGTGPIATGKLAGKSKLASTEMPAMVKDRTMDSCKVYVIIYFVQKYAILGIAIVGYKPTSAACVLCRQSSKECTICYAVHA